MKKLILLPVLAGPLFLAGCLDFPNDADSTEIEGDFDGTFRITYNAGTDSAETEQGGVHFSFDGERYDVDGEKLYLPPRGGGKYEMGDGAIVLTDLEPHTDEFDHSLILDGTFNYELEGETLTMTQRRDERNRYRKIDLRRNP